MNADAHPWRQLERIRVIRLRCVASRQLTHEVEPSLERVFDVGRDVKARPTRFSLRSVDEHFWLELELVRELVGSQPVERHRSPELTVRLSVRETRDRQQ